jgi:diaminopimelate decarboxylase
MVSGFERIDGRLHCDGVPLEDLARLFGTPLYVYSRDTIRAAYAAYDSAFASVSHRVLYALKANGTGGLLRVLAALGAGADVVSGFELRAALRAGFPPETIVFSGVGKTDEEIALGVASGIEAINAESEEEIAHVSAAALQQGRAARVSLRVNPDIDARSHPYISTGLRENKFGMDIGAAEGVVERAQRLAGITITGLQCHIGSQIRDLEPMVQAIAAIASLSRRLLSLGARLETIDLGGGLGVDYEGGSAPDPAALASRVLPELRDLGLTVLLEPGRSLVAQAGVLVTRVLALKQNQGKRFVITDAGMNDLVRPALYGAFHRIEPAGVSAGAEVEADIVGPVCETGDFLARGRRIASPALGDLLVVRDAGAYGFAMASNYNMRPRPAEVLVEDGTARLIRRRETLEDLLLAEVE